MLKSYVVLLRGINVGGKNKLSMSELKSCLTDNGFRQVNHYIQSGNIVLQSDLSDKEISSKIETLLSENFTLDSSIIRVLALESGAYNQIIDSAPADFGIEDKNYRYEVIFLMDISTEIAMREVDARKDIDTVWQGKAVIYYRRPGSENPDYTKSYLSKLVKKKIYQSVTIRNWNTVKKLSGLLASQKD